MGAAAITAPTLLIFRVEDLQGLTALLLLDRNCMRATRVALIF